MGLFSRRQNDTEDSASSLLAQGKASRRTPAREAGEPLDPAETQKRRARRRLIGATVLVLTVIVFLPMLFDPGPKPLGDDIVVQIPDKESAFNSAVPGKTPAPVSPATNAPAAPAAAVVPAPPSAPAAPVVAAVPAATPPAKAAAPAAPTAAPATAASPAPATTDAPKKDDGTRALAMLEGKADAKAPAKADSKTDTKSEPKTDTKAESKPEAKNDTKADHWSVQIGAFASTAKVKDLRAKLEAAGLKSYTETLKTPQGDRIRVRVGPYTSRAEAEKAKERVKKHLVMDGAVVPG